MAFIISLYEVLKVHWTLSTLSVLSLKIQRSGAEGIRTPDPLLARQVLSQLSYNPGSGFIYFLCQVFVCLAMGLNEPFLHPRDSILPKSVTKLASAR